jgi:hypothetical protein
MTDYPALAHRIDYARPGIDRTELQRALNIAPFAPAGMYSAGLGARDIKAQILFAEFNRCTDCATWLG